MKIPATGVILAAVYMLWMFQRVMFGTVTHPENEKIPDMTRHELATLIPILALIFWIGIYPKPFLDTMDASVKHVLEQAGHREGLAAVQPRAELAATKHRIAVRLHRRISRLQLQ